MPYTETSTRVPSAAINPEGLAAYRADGAQVDWTAVDERFQATPGTPAHTVVAAAEAVATATSITVEALEYAIPAGTVLDFEGAGKFAILDEDADAGATTLSVEALDATIDAEDEATAPAIAGSGKKTLPAFTACALVDGKLVPRSADNAATVVLLTDATEDLASDSKSGYGFVMGGGFYEELMPDFVAEGGEPWATIKTELLAAGAYYFRPYSDSSAS